MTASALHRNYTILTDATTRREIAQIGASRLLPSWEAFIQAVEEFVNDLNNRPHRSLPRITDSNGKRRHMTPVEMWNQKVAHGAEIVPLDAAEAEEALRRQFVRKARRCTVSVNNHSYFSNALSAWEKREVIVLVNPDDAKTVVLREVARAESGEPIPGARIGTAVFEHNKKDYVPKTLMRQATENRTKGRLARVEKKAADIREHLRPQISLAAVAEPATRSVHEKVTVADVLHKERNECWKDDATLAQWLCAHPEAVSDSDRELIGTWLWSKEECWLLERAGVDLKVLAEIGGEIAKRWTPPQRTPRFRQRWV